MAPRHDPTKFRGIVTSGRFVARNGDVFLIDDRGDAFARTPEACTIIQGGFGGASEGCQKLPRVERLDSSGQVVVKGDRVLIFFDKGSERKPVVICGVQPIGGPDFVERILNGAQDENAFRMLLQALDTTGAAGGTVRVEANAGDGGAVTIDATVGLTLRVGALDSSSALAVAADSDKLTVSAGEATEAPIMGRTYLTDLNAWNTAFTTFLVALAADATNPAVQAAATAMATAHASFVGQIAAGLAGTGAPLLAQHVEIS